MIDTIDFETAVTIDFFQTDLRIFQLLQTEDFAGVQQIWNNDDPELKRFAAGTVLEGAERWYDLTPVQFRLLIVQAIEEISALAEPDITPESIQLKRLRFFIGALILRYLELTGDHIEMLKIQHLGNSKVNFQTLSTQTIGVDLEQQDGDDAQEEAPTSLRVVVDNTKGRLH